MGIPATTDLTIRPAGETPREKLERLRREGRVGSAVESGDGSSRPSPTAPTFDQNVLRDAAMQKLDGLRQSGQIGGGGTPAVPVGGEVSPTLPDSATAPVARAVPPAVPEPDPVFDFASPTLPEGLDVRDLGALRDYLAGLKAATLRPDGTRDFRNELVHIRDGLGALDRAVQEGVLDLDTRDGYEQSFLGVRDALTERRDQWLTYQDEFDAWKEGVASAEMIAAWAEKVGLAGRLKNAALNVGAGLTEGLTVAPTRGLAGAAHLLGMDDTSEALRRGADDLQSRIDNKTDPLLDQLPESEFTRVVGSTVPYALAGGGGGAVLRTAGRGLLPQAGLTRIGATAATATLGAVQNAGERFEAASQFMERGGEDVRDQATVTGALLGTFEAFGTGGGRGVRQVLARRLADQSGPLGRFTTGVLREAGLEGNQETLTQLANDLTSLYMENPDWQFDPETFVRQWALAAAAGGLVSAPGVAAQVASERGVDSRQPDTSRDASTTIPEPADSSGDRVATVPRSGPTDGAGPDVVGLARTDDVDRVRDSGAMDDPGGGEPVAQPADGLRDLPGDRAGAAGELADATLTPEAAPALTEEVVQGALAEAEGVADTPETRAAVAEIERELRAEAEAEAQAQGITAQEALANLARAEQAAAMDDLVDTEGNVSMQEAGEADARLIDVARTTDNLQAALDGYEAARRQEALLLDSTETPDAAIADFITPIGREYLGDVLGETTNAPQATQRAYFRAGGLNPATGERVRTGTPAEVADAISAESGVPVTEAQVIDFIRRHPNGPGQYRSGVRAARREVMDNLREITGEPVSVARIERLLAERGGQDQRADASGQTVPEAAPVGAQAQSETADSGSLLPEGATDDAPFLLMDEATGRSVQSDVERIVSRVLGREALPETDASGRPTVQTVAGVEAFSALLPERGQALMQAAAERGLRALAVYVPETDNGSGRVVIDAEAAQARADREGRSVESVVRAAVLHEMVAHRGLRALLGEGTDGGANATRELAGIYREIGARRLREATDANGRSVWDKYAHQAERGEDGRLTDEGRALLAEEYLAWLAENLETADPGLLRRIYVRLRRAIRRALDLTLDDRDLEGLLYAAADALRGRTGVGEGLRFSQGDGLRYSLDGDSFAGVFSKEDEASLPTVTTLEEVRALAEGRPLYVRYSRGPHLDSRMGWRSRDHASGRTEAGLSVVRVPVEATDDVVLSRLTEYEDIKIAGGIRGYLLTGGIAGRDSDGGPVLSGVVPLAWLGDNLSIRGDASYEAINTIRLTATLQKSVDEARAARSDFSRDYATRQGATALLQLRALSEGRRWNDDVERVGTRRRYMEAGYKATGIDPDLGRALTTEEFLRQAEAYLRESPPNDPSSAGIDARFQLDGDSGGLTPEQRAALKRALARQLAGLAPPSRPDLANPATSEGVRRAVDAVDDVIEAPVEEGGMGGRSTRSRAQVEAGADAALETDYDAIRQALLDGASLTTAEEVRAAMKIIEREGSAALASGDPAQIEQFTRLVWRYREARAENARVLASGRDVSETPEERRRRIVVEAVFEPTRQTAKRLKDADETREAKGVQRAERMAAEAERSARDRRQAAERALARLREIASTMTGEAQVAAQRAIERLTGRGVDGAPVAFAVSGDGQAGAAPLADLTSADPALAALLAEINSLETEVLEATEQAQADTERATRLRRDAERLRPKADKARQKARERHQKEVQTARRALEAAGVDLDLLAAQTPPAMEGEAGTGGVVPGQQLTVARILQDPVAAMEAVSAAHVAKGGSLMDMSVEYWRAGLLSLPTTHAANVVGNSMNAMLLYGAERPVQALLGTLMPGQNKFDGPTVGELRHLYAGLAPSAWWRALQNARASFRTEIGVTAPRIGFEVEDPGKAEYRLGAIPGQTGRTVRTPYRLLLAADEMAKSLIVSMEVGAQAYRIAKQEGRRGADLQRRIHELSSTPGSAAYAYAFEASLEATFQSAHTDFARMFQEATGEETRRKPGAASSILGNARAEVPALNFILPFVETPINIINRAARLTPMGLVPLAYHIARQSGRRTILPRMAEQLVGGGILLAVFQSVLGQDDEEPVITGSRASYKDAGRYQFQQRAIPATSIRVGDTYYDYSRLAPVGQALVMMVDAAEAYKKGDAGAWETAFGSTVSLVRDQTFLQGIGDVIEAIESPDRTKSYIENFGASWVPNLVRGGLRSFDDTYRDTRGDVLARAAPLVFDAPVRHDIWGRPLDAGPGAATDVMYNLVSPIRQRGADLHDLDRMLVRWNQSAEGDPGSDDAPYLPSLPQRTFSRDGVRYEMDAETYQTFVQRSGERAAAKLLELAQDGVISVEAPTARHIRRLRDELSDARSEVKDEMIESGEIAAPSD